MKLKYTFETVEIADETVAVPVSANAEELPAVLHLNETASFILDHLREDTTEEALLAAVQKEYEGDPEQIRQAVHDLLTTLQENGIIE